MYESSAGFVLNRPSELADITGTSTGEAVASVIASGSAATGSWPPGSVPEMPSG